MKLKLTPGILLWESLHVTDTVEFWHWKIAQTARTEDRSFQHGVNGFSGTKIRFAPKQHGTKLCPGGQIAFPKTEIYKKKSCG